MIGNSAIISLVQKLEQGAGDEVQSTYIECEGHQSRELVLIKRDLNLVPNDDYYITIMALFIALIVYLVSRQVEKRKFNH